MTSLLRSALRNEPVDALAFDEWLEMFSFNGLDYPVLPSQSLGGKMEKIGPQFASYVQGAFASSGAVFACMLVRQLLFAEIRFQFRRFNNGRPGDLFGAESLQLLEEPWTNGTTGDLAGRAIQDADLAGNFFIASRNKALRRMRPDWTSIILGSKSGHELDMEPVGYIYEPQGPVGPADSEPMVLLPGEVAHFAPIPDPLARFRGMSWLTPVIREIQGDRAMTRHKLKFFEQGATPNLIVKFDPEVKKDMYDHWVERMESRHKGLSNAYKTLYLGGGADATIVGGNMKQIDFATVQGHGETRICAAGGVPPVIVGLSEGLKAATYSNYQSAMRRLADGTMRPLWRNFSASMAPLIKVPQGAQLWYDDRDIAFLKEDAKDEAEIQGVKAKTLSSLIMAGYEADSAVAAVEANDMSLLKHTGMVSVQMWKPGEGPDSAKVP